MDSHERAGRRSTDEAPAAEGSRNIGGSRNSMAGDIIADPIRRGLSVQDPSHARADKNNQDGFSPYFLAAAAAAAASAQAEAAARSSDSVRTSTPTKRDGATSLDPTARPYIDSRSPFPMSSSGNCRILSHPLRGTLPLKEQDRMQSARVRCSWAILSTTVTDDLHFLYADPSLRMSIREEYDEISFFSYIHPEDQKRTRADLKNIVESRTLFGSVTRCRFRPSPPSPSSSPRSASASKNGDEDGYTAIDIVVNWIGDDMALCFFHAIMDESAQDNDEVNKTPWSNWCGVGEGEFGEEECQGIWRSIQSHRTLKATTTGPSCVFQILSAVTSAQITIGTGEAAALDVLFSWPPPRLSVSESTSSAQSTKFADGSYFVDDFARLAQGVDKLTMQKELSDASTSCTRRFRARHTLTTEGMVRSVESVLIPYGSIVLACFRVTHAQMLPVSGVMDATSLSFPRQDDGGVGLSPSPASIEGQEESTKLAKRAQGQKRAENQLPAASFKVVTQKEETRASKGGKGGAIASSPISSTRSCQHCGRKDSPEWRKGRDGEKSLCNACGLRYARDVARMKVREERARLANEVAMNGGIIPPHLLKKAQTDKEERKAKKRKKKRQEGAKENEGGGARTIDDRHEED